MAKLLNLKHWQLFLLIFGVPIIFQWVVSSMVMTSLSPIKILTATLIVVILFFGLFFSWVYTLGTYLHKKLPETVRMNLTLFKVSFFILLVYMLIIPVFLMGMLIDVSYSILVFGAKAPSFASVDLLFLFSMISFFCFFYCIYFNAKALLTVERQKPVTFGDFVGEFFLFWFFLIGLWILQPRINKLFETSNSKYKTQPKL